MGSMINGDGIYGELHERIWDECSNTSTLLITYWTRNKSTLTRTHHLSLLKKFSMVNYQSIFSLLGCLERLEF